jgi:RalA-binding protein 1
MPTKVKISGPMNGTPIPLGHKFGSKEPEVMQSDRRDKVKSRMFQWGWRQHGGECLAAINRL